VSNYIYLDHHGDPSQKKVTIGFMHRNAVADLGANTRCILKERIETKGLKCLHLSARGPLWLALFNDYWLTDEDTYRYALSLLSLQHPFTKILIVDGGGSVDAIFERQKWPRGVSSCNPMGLNDPCGV
jgi:hypothetical protein